MQNKLFEYAVLRVVPRVEREEFLNTGIILYCREAKFIGCMYTVNHGLLNALYSEADGVEIENYLSAFKQICEGTGVNSPIAGLDIAARFRWLTAARSTILQTSKVHPGFCANPAAALNKLFDQLVGYPRVNNKGPGAGAPDIV